MQILFNVRDQTVCAIANAAERKLGFDVKPRVIAMVPELGMGYGTEMPARRAGGAPSYPAIAVVSSSCNDPRFRGQLVTVLSQDPDSPLRELVQLKRGDSPVSLRKALLSIHSELKEEYPT